MRPYFAVLHYLNYFLKAYPPPLIVRDHCIHWRTKKKMYWSALKKSYSPMTTDCVMPMNYAVSTCVGFQSLREANAWLITSSRLIGWSMPVHATTVISSASNPRYLETYIAAQMTLKSKYSRNGISSEHWRWQDGPVVFISAQWFYFIRCFFISYFLGSLQCKMENLVPSLCNA